MSVQGRLREAIDARIGVDTRGLAAFRILLGLVILADLLLRARDLRAFYTDAGVLPRATLAELAPTLSRYSLHAVSGQTWVVALLFVAAAAVAVSLTIGYRTRVAALASLLLVASLQARNPFVLNAGDTLLWQLLALSLLLPTGRRWSVDAVRRSRRREDGSTGAATDWISGAPSALLLTFVTMLYLSNGLVKLRGNLWPGGEAVRQVYRLEHLHGPLGDLIAQVPALLTIGTYGWLGLLLVSPLLLVLVGRARAALAGAFVAAHLSMALTLQIGVFPLVSVAGVLPFFPARVWDVVDRRVAGPADCFPEATDGLLLRGRTALPPLRSGDGSAGTLTAAFPPAATRFVRRVPHVVAAVLLVSLVVWNGMALGYVATPDPVADVADPNENRWDMFAPNPPDTTKLVVATAATDSGGHVDALYGDPVAENRSPSEARAYPSARWRKYLVGMPADPADDRDERLASTLCDRAAGATGEDIERVTISFVLVEVDVGSASGEPRAFGVADQRCE